MAQRNASSSRRRSVSWLRWCGEVRPDELRALGVFFSLGFTLLAAYYIVRALREGFILVDFGAGARSMAVGVAAAILIVAVPLYSKIRARVGAQKLVIGIYLFFIVNLIAFYFAWHAGLHIGFVFFVWVGLFGLLVVSQFWALANAAWNEDSGKRLFPLIMIGANLGALVGTEIADLTARYGGIGVLMIVALAGLVMATLMVPVSLRSVPPSRRPSGNGGAQRSTSLLGGFSVVFRDRYLLLIAAMVVLLNWVNSTGEYLFARFVEEHALATLGPSASDAERAEYVTHVYAMFMLWYTTLGLLVQTFLVTRLFRWLGIGRAGLILPVFVCLSYLLLAFVPIFSIVRWIKISENALDYSLMGTIRHALFLPTSEEAKFDGKTAIDTFFWRLGDLVQAGMVYAGVTWFDWSVQAFAIAALVVAGAFVAVSAALSREYRRRVPDDGMNLTNRYVVSPGEPVDVVLPDHWFESPPSNIAAIAAQVDGGTPLPAWLDFDPSARRFRGVAPEDLRGILSLKVETQFDASEPTEAPVHLVAVQRS